MHLLLIGGGEIGAQRSDGSYRPLETLEIDLYFISLLSKVSPKILFIPTAIEQKDPKRLYEKAFIKLYEGKLNCKVETLYLKKQTIKIIMIMFYLHLMQSISLVVILHIC